MAKYFDEKMKFVNVNQYSSISYKFKYLFVESVSFALYHVCYLKIYSYRKYIRCICTYIYIYIRLIIKIM